MTLIRREDAMGAVQDHFNADGFKGYDDGQKMMDRIKALPSAEAETKCIAQIKVDVDEIVERIKEEYDIVYEWIPCSEKLPEAPTFCLVTTDGSYNDVIDIALYMSDGWHKASEVLAWMPLPKPYREENEE